MILTDRLTVTGRVILIDRVTVTVTGRVILTDRVTVTGRQAE